ncbi:PR domain zinc finger protein 8-like [Salvelinus fontinalis]|uniref:PR domain zinc finger protein 8-like n=1 Tax=Salvelinus fontinalis TaxID=8038 RepID=UPI002485CF51|nr:PR domain zinc finger protein 8-like [Salvelinus fontinalis]
MKRQHSPVSCHLSSNINKNNITKDRATQLHLQQGSGPEDLRSSSSLRNQSIQPGSGLVEPQRDPKKTKTETLRSPSHSEELSSFTDSATVTSAFSQVSVSENRRSAFSQPPRSVSFPQTTPLLGRAKTSITPFTTDLHRPVLVQGVLKQKRPLYSPAVLWTRTTGKSPLQVQISLSPVLLSPSVSRLPPLCLTAQNWSAKCNASFRLTSDLVQQYDHHKRAVDATESGYGVKQQQHRAREERLKSCIYNEVFRQRHHLAGHLTSHT